jgi:ABC-2 type transport system permease protein
VACREFKRMSSRPLYILVTLLLPLMAFGIIWAIFSRGVPRDLPVAVYDGDHSALSRRLIRMIDSSSAIEVVRRVTDPESGHRLIREGKVYALIVLQRDLQKDVLSGKAPPVINYYNNEFLLPGSLIARDVRNAVGTLSAGLDLRFRQRLGQMTQVRPGGIEPIRIESHVLFNPYLNYTYFLVSTLLPNMLQIFVMVMSVYALGVEFKEGTAGEWLDCAGKHTWKALLGKLLPYTLLFCIVGIFMNNILFRYLGVPLRGSLGLITLAGVLMILAYQAVALLLVSITANLRLSLSFAAFYASTAFAFVGVTFPTVGMPLPAKAWAGILPLYYYLRVFVDQAVRGTPAVLAMTPLAVLMAFILFLPIFPLFRMGRLMSEEKYWGRL